MNKVCAFTGHRELPANKIQNIVFALSKAIDAAIADGYKHFISGGAKGCDIIAARLVTERIDCDESITLSLYLPFPNFVNEYDYAYLKPYCSKIIHLCDSYNIDSYMLRNKKMVDDSDRIICLYSPTVKGGTYNTMQYAKRKDIEIVPLNFDTFPED